MIEHRAKQRIRFARRQNGKGSCSVTIPKHLANILELEDGDMLEWTVVENDDGTVEGYGVFLF